MDRKKVLVMAVCDAIWADHKADLTGLRKTLDSLVAGDYKNAPCIGAVLSEFKKANEKDDYWKARCEVVSELLRSGISLSPSDAALAKELCPAPEFLVS